MADFSLAELLEITKDGEWGKGEPTEDTVPMLVIRGTDFAAVRAGDLSNVPIRHIPSHIAQRKSLKPQDILIETAGGTKDQPTGRTVLLKDSVFQKAQLPLTCASFSRFLRAKPQSVRPDFLFWSLQNLYRTGVTYPYHIQHTGVARFQYTQFAGKKLISCPPHYKQKAIAELLNALDDKLELNRHMNETLESLARVLFKDWFVDFGPTRAKAEGQRPPGLLPNIAALFPDALDDEDKPVGWEFKPVSELFSLVRSTVCPSEYPEEIFNHYSIPAFDGGQSPAQDEGRTILSNKTVIPDRAILLSKLNPETPRVWLVSNSPKGRDICSTEFLVLKPISDWCRSFGYCLLNERWFRERLSGMVTGTSKSHQRVAPQSVLDVHTAIPSGSLIRAFASIADPLLERVASNRTESQTLAQLRDLLLPKLMSGEIRLKEAEQAVEAIL